jgi:hypothetical protein
MTPLIIAIASLLADSNAFQCPMNPLPVAVHAAKASKDTQSFVLVNTRTMSILLKDGTLVRVISMGCVDSGVIANAWINNPPPAEDEEAWRKLLTKITSAAFDPAESKGFATWISDAEFTRSDNFLLHAGTSGNVDMSIYVKQLSDKMGAEATISFIYH